MDETKLHYEGWRVAAAGGVGVFLAAAFVYTFGIFLKPLTEEFAWSRQAVSTAYAALAMTSALASIPLGYLLDRVPPRRIVIPSLGLAALAFGSLSALTASLWHLYATFAALGLAGAGTSPMAYSRAVASWFARRRGVALALVVAGASAGALVHPPVAALMMRILGWRAASLAFAAAVVVIGLPTIGRFVRERPAAPRSLAASPGDGASVADGLASRVFWIQIVVLFCGAMAQNAAIVHLAPLLTDRAVSPRDAALAVSAMGAAGLSGRLLTGFLLDRFFAPYVSLGLVMLTALGTLLLSEAGSAAVGALAAMCIGFGMGGESDVTPYMFSRYFGLRAFSTLYGFTWTATGVAAAIGPVLMGRAFDATGSYTLMLQGFAAMTLAAASLILWMPAYDAAHPRPVPTRCP
jgi:predicted MFS family arabinose efflux permease